MKIYRDAKPQGTYYRVVYYLGSKRERLNFADLQTATLEAEAKASQLARGDVDALQLTGRDRLEYGRALEAIKPFGLSLEDALKEYEDSRNLLNGVSLVDAARFYLRHHDSVPHRRSVASAVDEMIAAKQASGVSELYVADLRYRLGAFKNAFHCDVNALTPDDLSRFFEALHLSPRSFNNFLRTAGTFFAFAQKRGWLSKEADLLARVEKRREKSVPVEIFTPAEMAALLQHASAELATCLALGAFAGLRAEEILRIDWADLERRPKFVEVGAHKAKTATRRLVPLSDNLVRWLAVAPRATGRVWQHSKPWFFESLRNAAAAGGITLKQNATRHSWISYRLAEVQDVNRVAIEAGNSPQMIYRNYRELVTPLEAQRYFAITPAAATNILPMQQHTR